MQDAKSGSSPSSDVSSLVGGFDRLNLMDTTTTTSQSLAVKFRGCSLPGWHVSQWTTPALMLIVAPKEQDALAQEFIQATERHLDNVLDRVPKFVALHAETLHWTSTTAILSGKWNVILRYKNMADVPGTLAAAAQFVVLYTLLLPAAQGPLQLWNGLVNIREPLLPVTPQTPALKWNLHKETGQWIKAPQPSSDPIPTVKKAHYSFYNTHIHIIPFVVLNCQTNSMFADVM